MQDSRRGTTSGTNKVSGGRDTRRDDKKPDTGTTPGSAAFAAEVQSLRTELDERTQDLQRLTAEYANYRRRMDRDRALLAEQATGAVLAELLGVLDDIDRARDHGDLVGPFGAVSDQLVSVLTKLGLTPFGDAGDPFDPSRHEAVAHSLSSEVTEPTCVQVFRRGYGFGERLLRPALVAVADPTDEEPVAAAAASVESPQREGSTAGEAEDTAIDTDAVDADAVEAEVVEGEVVDPEAAAVADQDQDDDQDDDGDTDSDAVPAEAASGPKGEAPASRTDRSTDKSAADKLAKPRGADATASESDRSSGGNSTGRSSNRTDRAGRSRPNDSRRPE